jgi:hypothetical protein
MERPISIGTTGLSIASAAAAVVGSKSCLIPKLLEFCPKSGLMKNQPKAKVNYENRN